MNYTKSGASFALLSASLLTESVVSREEIGKDLVGEQGLFVFQALQRKQSFPQSYVC